MDIKRIRWSRIIDRLDCTSEYEVGTSASIYTHLRGAGQGSSDIYHWEYNLEEENLLIDKSFLYITNGHRWIFDFHSNWVPTLFWENKNQPRRSWIQTIFNNNIRRVKEYYQCISPLYGLMIDRAFSMELSGSIHSIIVWARFIVSAVLLLLLLFVDVTVLRRTGILGCSQLSCELDAVDNITYRGSNGDRRIDG